MTFDRDSIIFIFVGLYMIMCIGVGLWAMRRTKDAGDFFMAGRNLGFFVTALAMFSSLMSGFGFVGGPGLVYRMGTSPLWIFLSVTIGFMIMGSLLGKRLRLYGELTESVSLPDVVAARYRNEGTRFLTAIAIVLGVIGYLGTQIMAMAVVLQGIVNSVDWIPFQISAGTAMVVSCAVLVFYCVTGGIIASVYTDLVQGSIMIVAAVLVFLAALSAVDGGFAGMVTTLHADDAESVGTFGTLGMMGALSWYFVFAVGLAGQPHLITKLMMTRSVADAKRTVPLGMFGYAVTTLLILGVGFSMRALVLQGAHSELTHPDQAAAQFLQNYTSPILAGTVIAGLFAAVMSTADAFLNIGVAAIVHDIPKALGFKKIRRELLWSRVMTVLLAVFSIVFVILAQRAGETLVALLGAFGFATFGAALVPTVAIGLNWKRATPLAANTAMATSLTLIFVLQLGGISLPYGIDRGALALAVSLFLFFTISLLSRPKPIDPSIEAIMDL